MKLKFFNREFQIQLLKLTKIELHKFLIDKSEFDHLDIIMKKRFTMITLFLSDLHLLLKTLLISSNVKMPIEELKPVEWINYSIQLRIVIAKIFEFWKFIDRNKILVKQDTFSQELKGKASSMSEFFNNNGAQNYNLFSFIRDKLSFHYEYRDDIDTILDNQFNQMNEIELWISSDDSNSMFVASDLAAINVIVDEMKRLNFSGNDEWLFIHLFNLTSEAGNLCRSFCFSYLGEFFINVLNIVEVDKKEFDVPSIKKIEIPLFVTR